MNRKNKRYVMARIRKAFKLVKVANGDDYLLLKGSRTASNRSRPLNQGTTSCFI